MILILSSLIQLADSFMNGVDAKARDPRVAFRRGCAGPADGRE